MKFRTEGIMLMTFASVIYGIIMLTEWKTAISYSVVLCIICIAVIIMNKSSLVCANTLFLAYSIYSFGLGPIFLLTRGINYSFGYFETILGGLLAFGWGNAVAILRKKTVRPIDDKWKYVITNIKRKNMLRICFFISLLASLYYISSNRVYLLGGDINANRIAAQSGNGMILYISQLPIMIVPMFYDLYHRGRLERKKCVNKCELVMYIVISSVTLLFSGFRAPLMTMYICLAVLFIQKNRIKSIKVIIMGIFFVILVEILGYVRKNMSESTATASSFLASFSTSFVVNSYNLNYIFSAFPSRVPFQRGYTYLINFLMLLPGPDQDFTLWLKDQLNLLFSGGGVTPTIIGEFYINFGKISIYVGMFLLGIAGISIYEYFKKHSETFLGVFYVWQFAHCASGGIANVVITVLLYTIVYWGLMLFPAERKKSSLDVQCHVPKRCN